MTDERTEDGGKWKIGQCSVRPETAIFLAKEVFKGRLTCQKEFHHRVQWRKSRRVESWLGLILRGNSTKLILVGYINQKLLLFACYFRTLLFHGLESDWLEDECDDEVFRKEIALLFIN